MSFLVGAFVGLVVGWGLEFIRQQGRITAAIKSLDELRAEVRKECIIRDGKCHVNCP